MAQTNYNPGKPANGAKYFIATPAYDAPSSGYTFSLQDAVTVLTEKGVNFAYMLLSGNCHVDDARNEIVRTFLASDCTHLVFLDADVSFTGENLMQLIAHDQPLVGGVYSYRKESKELPVRLLGNEIDDNGLLAVEGLPTGFLKISRGVFDAMKPVCESYQDTTIYFERTLIDGTRWGGDLNFCNRWRSLEGTVYADPELRLGHAGKKTYTDSLGALLRRQSGATLRHVATKVREGAETTDDIHEAIDLLANNYTANPSTLMTAIKLARNADGPIIETGSGLTTILMAAATDETVFCLENNEQHAHRLRELSRVSGVKNIGLCVCPIKDGWYDLEGKTLPDRFAFGLNDGPSRKMGYRMPFFDHFNPDVIVIDDVDEMNYREEVTERMAGRQIDYIEPRTMVIR